MNKTEYTGLCDMYGNMIHNGDIVYDKSSNILCRIKWGAGYFRASSKIGHYIKNKSKIIYEDGYYPHPIEFLENLKYCEILREVEILNYIK